MKWKNKDSEDNTIRKSDMTLINSECYPKHGTIYALFQLTVLFNFE